MLLRGRGSAWVCYPSAIGPCVRRWIAEEKGATATEYSLIAGLMALAIVSGVAMLGDNLGGTFTDVAAEAGPTAASNSQGGSSQDAGSGGNAAGATTPATSAGVGTSGAASSGAGTAAGSGGAATSGSEFQRHHRLRHGRLGRFRWQHRGVCQRHEWRQRLERYDDGIKRG